MAAVRRRAETLVTDVRVWVLVCAMIGLPAIGILLQSNAILAFAIPIVYPYLFLLGLSGLGFPDSLLFWAGFTLYSFAVASILVYAFDRARDRWKVPGRLRRRRAGRD